MMIKQTYKWGLIAAILLLLVGAQTRAQQVTDKAEVANGDALELGKKSTLNDIVGADDEHYYAVVVEKKGYFMMKFTHDMKLVLKTELDLEYKGKDQTYEFMLMHNSRLILFTSFLNQKDKVNYFFSEEVDVKTLTSSKELTKLAAISYKKRYHKGDFSYSKSIDEKKLLVYYNLAFDKGAKEKVACIVYDETMTELWEKEVELPYLDEFFSVAMMKVDNDGSAYLVGKSFKEDPRARGRSRSGPTFTYKIIALQDKGMKRLEFDIDGDEKFITDLSITINDQLELIAAGFFSERGSWSIKGSIFLRIDCKTGKVLKSSFKEFEMDFITASMTERQVERAEKKKEKKGIEPELYQYDLRDLIVRGDGGCVLFAEQFYVRVHTTTSSNGNGGTTTHTTYTYYYNDVIAVNISPAGEIEWHARIPKRQISRNDGGRFSSYLMAVVKDRIFLIFNDDPRNLNLPEGERPFSADFGKTAVITLVQLTADGETTREALHYNEGEKLYTVPKLSEQISIDKVILFAKGRKTVRFAKVSFVN
jgi:hypothetical protein